MCDVMAPLLHVDGWRLAGSAGQSAGAHPGTEEGGGGPARCPAGRPRGRYQPGPGGGQARGGGVCPTPQLACFSKENKYSYAPPHSSHVVVAVLSLRRSLNTSFPQALHIKTGRCPRRGIQLEVPRYFLFSCNLRQRRLWERVEVSFEGQTRLGEMDWRA